MNASSKDIDISDFSLFRNFTDAELSLFIKKAKLKEKTLPKNFYLIVNGDKMKSFYLVLSGAIAYASYRSDAFRQRVISYFSGGDIFGIDVSLSKKQTSPFDIMSLTEAKIVEVDKNILQDSNLPQKILHKLNSNAMEILPTKI
jgi:CRP-like cAMP-binding protein